VLQQLGHEMQVRRVGKKLRQFPEASIAADLLQVGLGQAGVILAVLLGRTLEQSLALAQDGFLLDQYPLGTLALRLECQRIGPRRCGVVHVLRHIDLDPDFGVGACMKTPQLGQPATFLHGLLQASTFRLGDRAQEAEHIEQVRLSRCVRADDISARPKRNLHVTEIAPVLELESGDQH
jgi:hypothetical protein